MDPSGIHLVPIARVRSSIHDRREMTTLGVPARIEVFPPYQEGLWRLEKHSHIWILAWLHQADRDRLWVIPRGVEDQSEQGRHGVFAVRSPTRPNPIALTVARILRIDATQVEVDRLDFTDGTPILDLKPYFRSKDCIFSARSEPIGRPATPEAALESLVLQAVNFHGEFCSDVAFAARVVECLRREHLDDQENRSLTVRTSRHRGCQIDALMGMLGVSAGRGTLRWGDSETVTFSASGLQYHFTPLIRGAISPQELLTLPQSQLFDLHIEKTSTLE